MVNPYETEPLLREYLALHYGEGQDILGYPFGPVDALGFPQRCVRENMDLSSLSPSCQALDLGCAVGRSALELSRHCGRVVAIDYSANFIRAARELVERRRMPVALKQEGDLQRLIEVELPGECDPTRVDFRVGDAQNLPDDLGNFEVVLAANLLCRLQQPQRLLQRLPQLVKSGGQLVLTTPCTWMEEFTPRENWLGGFYQDGTPVSTLDTLKRFLETDFRLESARDMPFLIREHARKFQWSVAQATRWRRL